MCEFPLVDTYLISEVYGIATLAPRLTWISRALCTNPWRWEGVTSSCQASIRPGSWQRLEPGKEATFSRLWIYLNISFEELNLNLWSMDRLENWQVSCRSTSLKIIASDLLYSPVSWRHVLPKPWKWKENSTLGKNRSNSLLMQTYGNPWQTFFETKT